MQHPAGIGKILRLGRRRIKYQGSVMYEPYFPAASIRLTVLVCHVRIVNKSFTRIASPKLPLLLPCLEADRAFQAVQIVELELAHFFSYHLDRFGYSAAASPANW